MIKYFILLLCLCLVVIDASLAAVPSGGVPDLLSACPRIDIWGSSEVAKALCGATCYYKNCAIGICIKSQGRPVCSCSRCAPGAVGGIDCALSETKWNQPQSKRKQGLTFKKAFSLIYNNISFKNWKGIINFSDLTSRKGDQSSWSPSTEKGDQSSWSPSTEKGDQSSWSPSTEKGDQSSWSPSTEKGDQSSWSPSTEKGDQSSWSPSTEKNLDKYTESILWLYLFCDRIISSAKRVHICWTTNLYVSAPNLPHSLAYFRLEQRKLVKK